MSKKLAGYLLAGLYLFIMIGLITPVTLSYAQVNSNQSIVIYKDNSTSIVDQKTTMSISTPGAKLNNQTLPHQIVVALPPRLDGKIWTGTVTFTASKPIEVEVLHRYNPTSPPDLKHGEPYNAKWIDGSPVALSTMTMFSNTPVTVTNTPISTGSFVFTGSALLFHKTSGDPFTVTYTIDVVAKPLSVINRP
jgi:hypothetical protein